MTEEYDSVIVGGGFFGCSLALYLRQHGQSVLIIEMEPDLMQRASYVNQARVHNGYHYPRSITTALRSRINFPKFVRDYKDCIMDEFEQYYAVGKKYSKVSATQYRLFMERIGAQIKPAPKKIRELVNPNYIEDLFLVTEYAFDAVKLKDKLHNDLEIAGIDIWLNTKVEKIVSRVDRKITVFCLSQECHQEIIGKDVYNVSYAHINQVLSASNLPIISLKHEVTEMALIELPDVLKGIGITVMCGPFFSFMPFPPKDGMSTLSHVRYTPHCSWHDSLEEDYIDSYNYLQSLPKKSNYLYMIRDAQRYIPALARSKYIDSIWEMKTVLPQSEVDDSRPILMQKNYGIPHLHCIMGGKIDNIYDVFAELGEHL